MASLERSEGIRVEIQEIEGTAAVLLKMCLVEMAADNLSSHGCPDTGKERADYVVEKKPP